MGTEKSGLNFTGRSCRDSRSSERSEDRAGGSQVRSGLQRLLLLPLSPDPGSAETSSENVLPALSPYKPACSLLSFQSVHLNVSGSREWNALFG